MKLLVETYDLETECIKETIPLEIDLTKFVEILGWQDFDPRGQYELESNDILKLNQYFSLNIDLNSKLVKLRKKVPFDDLPYQIHTNRELKMMLEGNKPLSVFVGTLPTPNDFEEIPERLFDKYVASGQFVKCENIEPIFEGSLQLVRRVLYALPSESWRIKAYILLQDAARKSGWCASLERMEGSLLGYTDTQNDIYLEHLKLRESVSSSTLD